MKLFLGQKDVVFAVFFTVGLRARSSGDAQADVVHAFQDFLTDSAFAHARRATDDNESGCIIGTTHTGCCLFYVLRLFLDSVYTALDIDHAVTDICIIGLAGNGIGFSEHLLTDEIQSAPRLVVALAALGELL